MKSVDADSVIVSVDKFSLDAAMKSAFYATKRSFSPNLKFIFFYEIAPKSAITYYAEIERMEQGGVKEVGNMYWLRNMPESSPPFTIMRLKSVTKLNKEVKKDTMTGIQGPVYASSSKIKNSVRLSELIKA